MSKIILVSGEKQIGKTTTLFNKFSENSSVGGVLMPVIDDVRHFYFFSDKTYLKAETNEFDETQILVGRFCFSKTAFEKANSTILKDVGIKPMIIIDEIGPLELKSQNGLFSSLNFVLEHISEIRFLIFVVRPSLLEELKQRCENYCKNVSIIKIEKK